MIQKGPYMTLHSPQLTICSYAPEQNYKMDKSDVYVMVIYVIRFDGINLSQRNSKIIKEFT